MKRELIPTLLLAALLVPGDAEAQRGRHRDVERGPRVVQRAPVTVSGRLAGCRPPRDGRAFTCAAPRVVYSSRLVYSSRPVLGTQRVLYRNGRVRARFDWGRAPIRVRARVGRFDDHLNPGELRRLLGKHTIDRIRRVGRDMGLRGAPRGHWIDEGHHGVVLLVTMEGVEVVEFVDFEGDGLFDDAFFADHHRIGRRATWP